ncbi:hotdog fold thioesterase [Vibrio viridaestus]|uniref:Hotdog fold thioesterase n=1 Tax=Vibrio viridaestus TaxID=2487322 RepID=A0A3N9TJT2_9VIBR|nr:hotdog fold thioesterase [Vibrio viridaestus]RQW64480.1 hotdog fold thioesterase [Vibrio viridaestus]
MRIWKKKIDLDTLNATSKNTLIEHLGIQYSQITDNTLSATMPVCSITHQPLGMLHGGASVVLAETLGSLAANFCVPDGFFCVGLDINANHVRAVREGIVTGTAEAIHLGTKTQVWQININNDKHQLVCSSRLTIAVMKNKTRG